MALFVLLVSLLCTLVRAQQNKLIPLEDGVRIDFSLVGCYRDKLHPRALETEYFSARRYLGKRLWENWPDMSEAIRLCAEQAYTHGYREIFAVQNYGECWSGQQASAKYARYRKSSACKQGVGGPFANSVYRLKVVPLVESSTCSVNGRNYSEGERIKMHNEYQHVGDAQCQECTCSRGRPARCHTLHYCDLNPKACEKFVTKPGHCCPVCGCFHAGRVMSEGDTWVKRTDTTCVECTCQKDGTAFCQLRRVFCPVCDYPMPVEGQCCPTCVRVGPTEPKYEVVPTTEMPAISWE